MSEPFLYRQIAEAVRQEILDKTLQPGDRLPSVREMAARWHCTIGTVQKAYEALSQQGLVVSRPGQGTHVSPASPVETTMPLRRAALVNRAEAFLLELLTAGYTPAEVEQALGLALDRWRAVSREPVHRPEQSPHFVGSHDPALAFITAHFAEVAPDYSPQLTFTGSLGGLIALAEGEADLAGSHLWDKESDTYNIPFIRRLLPGRRVALLTLAHRRLGFILLPSNPLNLASLEDLSRSRLRFVNRQPWAGTRVWLDAQLGRLGLPPQHITGYEEEVQTHSEVARAVAEDRADVGLGIESAALAYGLGFIPLTTEPYDLVIPEECWSQTPIQALAQWLATEKGKQRIYNLGGYEIGQTGRVVWLSN
jgi:molybdate-binding protein/DNA-binding transcriptional regulator YhcF (GntR family)